VIIKIVMVMATGDSWAAAGAVVLLLSFDSHTPTLSRRTSTHLEAVLLERVHHAVQTVGGVVGIEPPRSRLRVGPCR
jgi:hypothetical protein